MVELENLLSSANEYILIKKIYKYINSRSKVIYIKQ